MTVEDPRENLSHDIQPGQVYGHARKKRETEDGEVVYDEKLRLVYCDDEKVLLRSDRDYDNLHGAHYPMEDRSTFEQQAATGFYKLLEDTDEAPPMPTDGIVAVLNTVKRQRDAYLYQAKQGGSRKDKHKLEAANEILEGLVALQASEMDFTAVRGVGEHTAAALRDAGIETDADVLAASDEQLLAVDGVGEGNLSNLRDAAQH